MIWLPYCWILAKKFKVVCNLFWVTSATLSLQVDVGVANFDYAQFAS